LDTKCTKHAKGDPHFALRMTWCPVYCPLSCLKGSGQFEPHFRSISHACSQTPLSFHA
jgi:hypothetical protein